MITYIIAYDLLSQDKDYKNLIEAIEAYNFHYKVNKSTWLIKTSFDKFEIYKDLSKYMDSKDSIIIAETNDACWINVECGDEELKRAF